MSARTFDAKRFVKGIDLAGLPDHRPVHFGAPTPAARPKIPAPAVQPKSDETQALVVGSQVQVFDKSVDAALRTPIMESVLLAQLAAKKASQDAYEAWYPKYFDVLSNIGWVIQDRTFHVSGGHSREVDVHESVLALAASLLGGPATTAYQIVAATLAALQKLKEDSPSIALFRRETQQAQAASFQVSVAEKDGDGKVSVGFLAFRLNATASSTTVLFFKFKSEEARFEYNSARLGIVESVLTSVAPLIEEKVAQFVPGYVKAIEI